MSQQKLGSNAINEKFRKFAHRVSTISGSPYAFGTSICIILIWFLMGPLFKYSDTWQLVINTGTTIITFLMVFLIQNTQNRDARALHLKLDELIRATKNARNQLIDLEELSDEALDKIHEDLCKIHQETEEELHTIRHHRSKRQSKR